MQLLRAICFVLLVPLIILQASSVMAFETINLGYFDKVALGGYDAVSYFSESRAVKGNKNYAAEWKNATWLFSSDANRPRFEASPEAFAPQYGGYCSNQMSLGNLSDIDVEVWQIIDNKLYLFGHDAGLVRWATETGQRVLDADQHWRSYLAR